MNPTQKIKAKLAELEAMERAATPGPWKMSHNADHSSCGAVIRHTLHGVVTPSGCADQSLIASSRTALPDLVKALRKAVEGLEHARLNIIAGQTNTAKLKCEDSLSAVAAALGGGKE